MVIEDKVKSIAESLAYDTFEINNDTANTELDGVEVEFDAGEIKIYLNGVYFIDFKSAFYKDDVFKSIRDELDKYKDKDLTDDELYEIASKAFLPIDEDYDYYVNEADSYFAMDMRNSIQWFDGLLGYADISVEGDDGGMIEGRVREILEEEYGHYGTKVFTDEFILGFSDYHEDVLVDYMCR